MTTALTRLSGSAFELTITVPWSDVKKIYDQVFEELAAEIEVEGFRKGKAPKNVIEEKIDKSKVYGEVINRLVPESYRQALEEHNLRPIVTPQVKISSADEEKDWQMIVSSAEKPEVVLGEYKKEISALNATGKIWKPGDPEVDEKTKTEEEKKKISKIIDKLVEVSKVELPIVLVDSEVNRLLTSLLEDIRAAGLTYEQYLQSSGQTADGVKQKYYQQAETALKLEFVLEAVADDLKIEVGQEEIKAIIDKETDQNRKKTLTEQSYILASVLRRDKTISRLLTI
jgi:trigger factor